MVYAMFYNNVICKLNADNLGLTYQLANPKEYRGMKMQFRFTRQDTCTCNVEECEATKYNIVITPDKPNCKCW